MCKRNFLILFITVFALSGFYATRSVAAGGEGIFTTLKCGMCHKPEKKAAAVSLKEIAGAYPNAEKLVGFFKGESRPVIESDKPGMMLNQMPKLKALPENDKDVLAQYMIGFK
ncbi:MAG: c-type cytochrome [Syntrophobacteraceae bacterium]